MRPNFFVNTPDILHAYLQYGGPPAFKIRAVLAATGSPSWGVYAGYELFEHVAVRPGSEEYLDSEKYQLRLRDWAAYEPGGAKAGRSLAPYLTRLNDIRRRHRRAAAAAQPHDPPRRQRRDHRLQPARAAARRRRGHRDRRGQPRPARRPRGNASRSTCPALAWTGRTRSSSRRDHRPDLALGPARVRPARPAPRAMPRARRPTPRELIMSDHREPVDDGGGGRTTDADRRPAVVQAGRVLRGAGPIVRRPQR